MKTTKNTNKIITIIALALLLSVSLVVANQCNDGIDNDLDGKIDFPQDDGCSKETDRTEAIILGYADGCLSKGDKLMDVYGNIKYHCTSSTCLVCVLITEAGNYTTLPSRCNGLPKCGFNGGGTGGNISADLTPPNLTIISPTEGKIYSERKISVDFFTDNNEKVDVYYLDKLNGKGRWTRLCTDCSSYSRERTFKEGPNDITFRAKDLNGNLAYFDRTFTIDSKKPKIRKSIPKKGITNGFFEIQFEELNPVSLILTYGNATLQRQYSVNIAEECTLYKKKHTCLVNINLEEFNRQQITYFLNLTDMAGVSATIKRPLTLTVDTTPPQINSINYTVSKNYAEIFLNVTDENFDEALYTYTDSRGRLREKRFCSRLKDNICKKRIRLNKDVNPNIFNIAVFDEAGNQVAQALEIPI